MAVKTACVKFENLEVALKFKRIKSTRIRINENGEISVSLPYFCTQKEAFKILEKNSEWIRKTYQKIQANLPKNDEFCLLGKIYKIKFDENLNSVLISDDQILAANLKRLEEFKKSEAKRVFTEFIDKFATIINRKINRVVIRKMQTRWGSCNYHKGYINLNLNLIEKEPGLIEYVILHELTHLIYPHHQKSFYEYIGSLMSDFKEREKRLNKAVI